MYIPVDASEQQKKFPPHRNLTYTTSYGGGAHPTILANHKKAGHERGLDILSSIYSGWVGSLSGGTHKGIV